MGCAGRAGCSAGWGCTTFAVPGRFGGGSRWPRFDCDLSLPKRILLRQVFAPMSFHQFYRTVFQRLENLDFHQTAMMVLIIVAFGFYCLRGFGSRHDY
jgi:hypothetical protein